MYRCTGHDALDGQALPYMYPAHHELESVRIMLAFYLQGLGDIYEEEFVVATASGASTAVDKQDAVRQEAKNLMKELFGRLDALSHFHYAPKPVIEEMQVRADVPALAMEEVAPQVGMLAMCCLAAEAHITCCAVLCCAVLCCAVLCCAVLCNSWQITVLVFMHACTWPCAVLCRAVPCCAVPCRAVPCRAASRRAVPCCAVLCRAVPCCALQVIGMLLSWRHVRLLHTHTTDGVQQHKLPFSRNL